MRKNKIFMLFIFFSFAFISFSANYNITDLNIVGNLQKDGSIEIQETINYDIEEINGVFFDIDTKGFGELEHIEIYEDSGKKSNGEYKYKKVKPSKYEISVKDDLYRIKLYSKNRNNKRSFLFVYTLPNAVAVYKDVAQLNRKMVGQNWQQTIDNIRLRINIPVSKNYDSSKILAFGHGPLNGYLDIAENYVEYNLENYYPNDFLEAHILMEPEIFSEIDKSKIVQKNMKQELLDTEKKLADDANREREKAERTEKLLIKARKYVKLIFGIETGFWAFLMFYIHRIFKKKNKYKNLYGKYLREAPDNFSPSLVGLIMTSHSDGQKGILATLLDLIRRKYIDLEEANSKTKLILKNNILDDLSPQEKTIVDIYFNGFGDGHSVILEDIAKQKMPMQVAKKFEKWQYQVSSEMYRNKFDYEGMGFFKTFIFLILGLAFFASVSFYMSLFDNPIFIITMFMGLSLIISALNIKRPTENLQKAQARWSAFKNFLEDYSQLEDAKISSIHLWEQYLVYAVAMGVSEKVVKAYKKALELGQIKDTSGLSVNLNQARAISLIDVYSRNNSFNRALNSATRDVYKRSASTISKTRRSSSSGRGGGFSSGSSGGGGSRGGGGAF